MWPTSEELLVDIVKRNRNSINSFKLQNQRLCILASNTGYELNVDFLSQLSCKIYKILNATNAMEVSQEVFIETLVKLQKNLLTLNENVELIFKTTTSQKDLIFSRIYKISKETARWLRQLEQTLPKQVELLRKAAKERPPTQMKQEIWSLLINMRQILNIQGTEAAADFEPLSLLNTLKITENLYGNLLHSLKKVLQMDFEFITDFGQLNELPFLTIDLAFYGIQCFVLVAFSICQLCDQLAENYFQHGCLEKCNDFIIENVNAFKANLIDEGNRDDFLQRLFSDDADLYLIERLGKLIKQALDMASVGRQAELTELLQQKLTTLSQMASFIQNVNLPILTEQPSITVNNLNFNESKIQTPVGRWQRGSKVSYALQLRNSEGHVSKIGRWSKAFTVADKACPMLEVPIDEKQRIRLIYRRFDEETPQLVGKIENPNETSFDDIQQELFDLASKTTEIENLKSPFVKLLKAGADLNAVLIDGRTIIHAAAVAANLNIMPHIMLSGNFVDIDQQDFYGYTALHLAAAEGHLEFVELLLKLNAKVNAQTVDELLTPLHLAAVKAHVEVVVALLKDFSIDINKKDKSGFTALHYAVLLKHATIIDTLLSFEQIDINAESQTGLTAFHLAIMTQNIEVIEIFLKNKQIEVNVQNEAKFSALHFAVMTKNLAILKLLLKCPKIDINSTAPNHFTSLHYAVLLGEGNLLNELLSFESINVNAKAAGDLTPLHMAVICDQRELVMALLKAGAEIDARTQQAGLTALHIAAKFGRETSLRPLIEHGANLNLKTFDGLTPLALAAYHETSHLACFRWLIESGAFTS